MNLDVSVAAAKTGVGYESAMDTTCPRGKPRAEVRPRPTTAFLAAMFLGLCCAGLCWAGSAANAAASTEPAGSLPTLTTTRQAHNLSSKEAARHYPVHLRAVVTYFDPTLDNGGYIPMFVHDGSGSIFVKLAQGLIRSLPAGSLIDLRGVTEPGEFAPIVAQPEIHVIGFSGLPTNPARPSLASLLTGTRDGQWVEVEGVIHAVVETDHHINLQLAMEDGNIPVLIGEGTVAAYTRLIDAKVRIRGNAGPLFDISRLQMIGANIQCPNFSAISVMEPAPADPLKLPIIPTSRLLQWDVAPLLAHRVHVQGQVSLQWPDTTVCIRDGLKGICAQTDQRTRLQEGELIDIAGFVKAVGSVPAMTDAVFRSSGSAFAVPIVATPLTAKKALLGGHESQLIEIEGQLVSRDLASADTTLLLTSGRFVFTAILPQGLGSPETTTWENGSVLRVRGICSVQLDLQRSGLGLGTAIPRTFRVLMRSPADVTVVQKPTWWTPKHTVLMLSLGLAFTLFVLGWVAMLRRRVQQQANLLRKSEERFRHMALYDALTGLATRLLLQDRLDVALESARRHGTGLAVLMVDLDRFKEINDTFGHQAGDEVLRVTAARVLQIVRKADTVARLGGDEFVVLLAELTDPQAAERIAAKIVDALTLPIPFAGRAVPVTVSVGVCLAATEELDADVLLRNADAALYHAKASGRNRSQFFTQQMASSKEEASQPTA